ncbi:saccharopine dehydrogenase C-terminal domain-containing protein [Pseudomonas gessardii]|uniref:saccharopine dehydrogenase C-terminal domain-containing protein n=1 Tax=Pseudomonas gessardii TaxID=78544 RepID=UPI0018D9BDB8|nr:saccharopine dehydrogenase C-terminal domain-containing protein [Pseudomonas gessardii]MBH3421681.1 saccharopine dehydrogenase NADP-binding domain-containing protein [Pseudomonas gessardii]
MKAITHVVIIGFGSITQGLLPLLSKHYSRVKITIFEKSISKSLSDIATEFSADLKEETITSKNFKHILSPHLNKNTFLVNLAISISSLELIILAKKYGSLYLDTCIEPWNYKSEDNQTLTSNYELREAIKKHKQKINDPTAIVAHGANPGFISILLKKALIEMAATNNIKADPSTQIEWAALAKELEIQVIQISEHDSQISASTRAPLDFISTWSTDGLITELLQPAELGWGTHEIEMPSGARKNGHAIEMLEQGREVRVKSWSPNYLEFSAYLLTHNEALSISEYLTLGDAENPIYRPTVYYAYEPCDQTLDSIQLLDRSTEAKIAKKIILKDEIISGTDELGVFLISKKFNSFWLGSTLSIGKTRKLAKHNSATSLQVVSSIISGMKWAEHFPEAGIVESENLDWRYIYDIAANYWEPIVNKQTDWKPSDTDNRLLFKNFLA